MSEFEGPISHSDLPTSPVRSFCIFVVYVAALPLPCVVLTESVPFCPPNCVHEVFTTASPNCFQKQDVPPHIAEFYLRVYVHRTFRSTFNVLNIRFATFRVLLRSLRRLDIEDFVGSFIPVLISHRWRRHGFR